MKIKISLGERIFDVVNVIIMLILMVIMFYPLWHVVCSSFSSNSLVLAHEGLLLHPLGFNTEAYKAVFQNPMIVTGFKNTLIILATELSINMLMTSIAAYTLAQKDVYWNKFFMKAIVFTMYFGGGLIPNYLLVTRTLGLDNTMWSWIFLGAINIYNLIIMRTSFMGIPDSLIESAKLDGASHFTILFKIVVPLSKAIFAVIALYYAVGIWNSWFNASIYLKDRSKYPIQLVLREILIQNDVNNMVQGAGAADVQGISETIKHAVIIITTVPILVIYPFLQKYFVKGTLAGAVKG